VRPRRAHAGGIEIPAVIIRMSDPETLRRITRRNAQDPRLEPTDRHLQRWVVSLYGGLELGVTNIPFDDSPKASKFRLPPLSDDVAMITDQVVASSPSYWQRFIHNWYLTSKPIEVIAKELNCERANMYTERRLVLSYVLGRLTEAGVRIASYRFR
jgi:hypothetical protein